MELLIKSLFLFIFFQIATTNYLKPIQLVNLGSFLRSPRNIQTSSNRPSAFVIARNEPFTPGITLPEKEYGQFQLFSNEMPQYKYYNEMQDQPQQFPLFSNDMRQYRSNNEMRKQPQNIPVLPKGVHQYKSDNEKQTGHEGPKYGNPLEVVDGYLRPQSQNAKNDENLKQLDDTIKKRVSVLQEFQEDFNKLLQHIADIALSFISKPNFFGGASRKSLFDSSNLESVRTIHTDLSKLGEDLYRIYSNFIADTDKIMHYISDHRNYNFRDLFGQAITMALRMFTFK